MLFNPAATRRKAAAMSAIDPDLLLRAYSIGVFPMADSRRARDIYWVEPKQRGILPLDGFRLSRSLARRIRSGRYRITADRAFEDVVAECAAPAANRRDSWINPAIARAYAELHRRGHASSIEVWDETHALVGGLYGVRLGRAFFGESMFSRAVDASKVALAHLVARLRVGGFTLLDCQFQTDHLASLGAIEIAREDYRALLDSALGGADPLVASDGGAPASGDFFAIDRLGAAAATVTVSGPASGCRIAQLLGQTSNSGFSTALSDGDSL